LIQKITLMEAYLIETLRSEKISDEEILEKTENRQAESFRHLHEKFDFTNLYLLADRLESILKNGYQITFVTFPGLVNLIQLKYDKVKDEDFKAEQCTITGLQLAEAETEDLKTWLSPNWRVEKGQEGIAVKPAHIVYERNEKKGR